MHAAAEITHVDHSLRYQQLLLARVTPFSSLSLNSLQVSDALVALLT